MFRKIAITAVLATAVFTASVVAHANVKDPDVQARMELMKKIGGATKALGDMAKSGSIDAAVVVENANALASHAGQIEAAFEKEATDPKSEAKPEIWSDKDGFLKIAAQLATAAQNLAGAPDTLPTAMGQIGGACSACHKTYRIKK